MSGHWLELMEANSRLREYMAECAEFYQRRAVDPRTMDTIRRAEMLRRTERLEDLVKDLTKQVETIISMSEFSRCAAERAHNIYNRLPDSVDEELRLARIEDDSLRNVHRRLLHACSTLENNKRDIEKSIHGGSTPSGGECRDLKDFRSDADVLVQHAFWKAIKQISALRVSLDHIIDNRLRLQEAERVNALRAE
ncbi:unnamed protein product [Oikopleura dioica]|uniref:Uncharacterized protein n=1 Tax=Oikopleura dioica TaxID=34765 RepID=E4XEW1_OIKDI|nr:unnamed protein product [Oikopleura dioica]